MTKNSFKKEMVTFHFSLGNYSEIQDFTLHVGATKYGLKKHTVDTLAMYRKENKYLALLDEEELKNVTHYVEAVEVTNESAQILRVTFDTGDEKVNIPRLAMMWVHIPSASRLRHRQKRINAGKKINHPKIKGLGRLKTFSKEDILEILKGADYHIRPIDIAVALLFHHPQLATIDPQTAAIIIEDHIMQAPDLNNFANSIASQGQAVYGGWATICPSVDKDGNPLTWGKDYPTHKKGEVVYQYNLSDQTIHDMGDSLSYALTSSQKDNALKNITWSVNQGIGAVHVQNPDLLKCAALAEEDGGYHFTLNNKTPGNGVTVYDSSLNYSKTDSKFSINVKNTFLRTLCAYVEFYDEAGNAITDLGDWEENLPDFLQGIFETGSKKFLSSVTCVNVIMGVPMPTDPTNLSFPWPEDAVSCKIMLGGAGTSRWDSNVDLGGLFLTGVFQYGIPALFMVAGAAITSTKWFKEFVSDMDNVVAVLGVAFAVVGGGTVTASALMNTKKVLFLVANSIAGIIAGPGLEKLAAYICTKLTEAEMEEAIPYASFAFAVANRAIDFAQISESTIEILCSPATYEIDVNRKMPLKVTVHPDPTHGTAENPAVWPEVSDHYQVIVQYQGGTNFIMTGDMPSTTSNEPLVVTFPDLPAGGQIQVSCGIYSNTNWLAGKWTSSWVNAELTENIDILELEGNIQENLVPLTADTYYSYKEKIVFDTVQQGHRWQPAQFDLPQGSDKALDQGIITEDIRNAFSSNAVNLSPDASVSVITQGSLWKIIDGENRYDIKEVQKASTNSTVIQALTHNQPQELVDSLNPSNTGHNLGQLVDITINDQAYMLGYAWRASGQNLIPDGGDQPTNSQLYSFQNINVLGKPEDSLKFTSYGFSQQPYILYDQFGPAPLFSMPIDYETDMDSGKISSRVRDAFATYGYPLPDNAADTVVVQGAEWYIGEAGEQPSYDITRVTDVLEVHPYPHQPYSQNNFYIDPVDDVYHLRKVTLDNTTPFDMSRKESWGYFSEPHMDAFIVHPQGYVIGVSFMNSKMEIIKIPDAPTSDEDAVPAVMVSGEGVRQGLMDKPVALNVTPDGRILVLETGNKRIQAFDINGNPVPSFDGTMVTRTDASYALDLDNGCVPAGLRNAFSIAGYPLSEEWNLQDGEKIYNIKRGKDGLAVTICGADISDSWTILDGDTTYNLSISGQEIDVVVNGQKLFALSAPFAELLDLGITDEVRNAFLQQGITLSDDAQISGDAFILSEDSLTQLCGNMIPDELVNGLKARLMNISDDLSLSSEVIVIIKKPGQQWQIQDLPQSNSYSSTFDKDLNQIVHVNYLSYMPLYAKATEDAVTYLDMASELKGYIYVLAYDGDGKKQSDYYIDIYEPGGEWVTRTYGVNAGKFTVDMWRNMFTLNYEHLLGPGDRTEPSISEWIPSTPSGSSAMHQCKRLKMSVGDAATGAITAAVSEKGAKLQLSKMLSDALYNCILNQVIDHETISHKGHISGTHIDKLTVDIYNGTTSNVVVTAADSNFSQGDNGQFTLRLMTSFKVTFDRWHEKGEYSVNSPDDPDTVKFDQDCTDGKFHFCVDSLTYDISVTLSMNAGNYVMTVNSVTGGGDIKTKDISIPDDSEISDIEDNKLVSDKTLDSINACFVKDIEKTWSGEIKSSLDTSLAFIPNSGHLTNDIIFYFVPSQLDFPTDSAGNPYTRSTVSGQVSYQGQVYPGQMPPTPPQPQNTADKCIHFNAADYVFNGLFWAFFNEGDLHTTVVPSMLADPEELNTAYYKNLYPPIYKFAPDCDMKVEAKATQPTTKQNQPGYEVTDTTIKNLTGQVPDSILTTLSDRMKGHLYLTLDDFNRTLSELLTEDEYKLYDSLIVAQSHTVISVANHFMQFDTYAYVPNADGGYDSTFMFSCGVNQIDLLNTFVLGVSGNAQTLKFNFTLYSVEAHLIESVVPGLKDVGFDIIWRNVIRPEMSKTIQKMGDQGVALPFVKGFRFQNALVDLFEGYTSIAADVTQ